MFILFISQSKCENKFLKFDNCSANSKVARVELCEITDGKMNVIFNITKPLDEFLVRIWNFQLKFEVR
jgi:hypothetical protein